MKLQRTTLILILLALSLGGFVYFHEIKGATQREEVKEKNQQIFSFEANDMQSLTVKTKNNTINLERNNNSEQPLWLMKSPEQVPASDAAVFYLTDLLVKGKSDRTLSISANQLGEYGLEQPQATIDVKLKNQKTHRLILGKPDFNRHFLYAQVDPATKPNSNVNVVLVSTDFENAVNRELSDWKQSPDDNSKNTLPNINKPTPALPNINKPTPAKTK